MPQPTRGAGDGVRPERRRLVGLEPVNRDAERVRFFPVIPSLPDLVCGAVSALQVGRQVECGPCGRLADRGTPPYWKAAGARCPARPLSLIAFFFAVGPTGGARTGRTTGPTGRTKNWPTTFSRPRASAPPAVPSSGSAPGSASGCTGRPTATTGATPRSRRRPGRSWPNWETGVGR